MELTRLLVYLLAGLNAHASLTHEDANAVTEAVTEEQKKVHLECRNSDYKKYLRCLMRPKRHHHGSGTPETDPGHCLETCLKKCDLEHDCEKKCGHCMKRTKHRHQIITEYETSCESGNCNREDGLRTTNITTNIDINNIINGIQFSNGTSSRNRTTGTDTTSAGDGTGNGGNGDGHGGGNGGGNGNGHRNGDGGHRNGDGPKHRNGNGHGNGDGGRVGTSCCPQFLPDCRPCFTPSMSLTPQISLVPQITYGIGLGTAGGCAYNQWLCIQQQIDVQHRFPSQPDCSGCGNPLLRYRCDVSCYMTQNTATNIGTPCKSPACIGGSS